MIPRLDPPGYGRKPPKRYKAEAERRKSEPWRKGAYGAIYRARRLEAIEATAGRRASCGRLVAIRTAGGWRMKGGEVHHVRPLAEGGHDGALVLLCIKCHRRADAKLRRKRQR